VAAATWGATVWLSPPVPGDALLATVVVLTAMAVAGSIRRGRAAVVAALTAGFVGSWAVVLAVDVMMPLVPDRWVPSIVTMAMTPAANVRESRIETVDPYIALLFLGTVMGVALVVALVPSLHRRLPTWLVPPVDPQVTQAVSPSS
jgi:hypothetical protein